MKKTTDFRAWVYHKWLENCDERDRYYEPKMSLQVYWKQYQKFLVDLYRSTKLKEKQNGNKKYWPNR